LATASCNITFIVDPHPPFLNSPAILINLQVKILLQNYLIPFESWLSYLRCRLLPSGNIRMFGKNVAQHNPFDNITEELL
jgi:hypothetical protein